MSRVHLRSVAFGTLLVTAMLAALMTWFAEAGSSEPLVPRAVLPFVASEPDVVPPTPFLSPTATPTPTPTSNPSPSPSPTAGGFDSARAIETSRYLSEEIGVRVAGTEAEQRAAEYIRGRFTDAGYAVELMPFVLGSGFAQASLSVRGQAVPARALLGSGEEAVTAPAVFAGLGSAADFAGEDLTGKVAIVNRGLLTFNQKATNAQAAGAIALIIINSEPGEFSGTLGATFSIPVIGVPGSYGPLVVAEAAAGHPMTVAVEIPRPTAINVIARPSAGDRCRVIVGGHYDTVPGSPGANDNASGTATAIELARATAGQPGVCFVAFSGEESGPWGSAWLVDRLRSEGRLPEHLVNLDVTGAGDGVEIVGSTGLRNRALALAAQIGIPARISMLPEGTSSDHASFQAAGVPAVMFTSGDFSLIHTPGDTVARLDEAEMDAVGEVALALVVELARNSPFLHGSPP